MNESIYFGHWWEWKTVKELTHLFLNQKGNCTGPCDIRSMHVVGGPSLISNSLFQNRIHTVSLHREHTVLHTQLIRTDTLILARRLRSNYKLLFDVAWILMSVCLRSLKSGMDFLHHVWDGESKAQDVMIAWKQVGCGSWTKYKQNM